MLALFAALVPILATIYATGSLLVEYSERARQAKTVERVRATYPAGQRELLLEANGVDPAFGSYKMTGRATLPQPPSRVERRRQWVLLLGSAVGVALLALHQTTAA